MYGIVRPDPGFYILADGARPFKSNYAQMKFDALKNHGRVFEDDGEIVRI